MKPLIIQMFVMGTAALLGTRVGRALALPRTQYQDWYRLHLAAWAVAAYTYFVLHRLDDARLLPGRLLVGLVAGALAGAIAGGQLRRLTLRNRARRALPGLLIILVALVVLLGGLTGSFAYCYARGCDDPWPPGPPASWPVQLAAAQDAARRIDPAATLALVTAYPPATRAWNGEPQTLTVHFLFENTALTGGSAVDVSLLDTAPAATVLSARSSSSRVSNDSAAEQARLRQALATVQISAADALQRTLPDLRAITAQHPGMASVNVGLRLPSDADSAEPVSWWITYMLTDPSQFLEFTVDAHSGAILSRKLEP